MSLFQSKRLALPAKDTFYMNTSDTLSIGIDFGGTSIKVGVVSGKEIIHESARIDPKGYTSACDLIDILAQITLNLKSEFPDVSSVGFGVPGFVNFKTGTIFNLTNVPGWSNVPLKDEMQQRTQIPVAVENDANCMAIAEWKLGAGQGKKNIVCLTIGTGVGGGVIVNNEIVRGHRFAAGELGQGSIAFDGRLGNYNNIGALEKYLGNNQIAQDAKDFYAAAGIQKDVKDCFPLNLSINAQEGDEIALQIWDDIALKLSVSLSSACYLLNPEAVVIGGGVANANELLFDPLNKYLKQQLSGPFIDDLQVVKAHFANEAGIIGAAALSRECTQDLAAC